MAWSFVIGGLAVGVAGAALVAISQNEIENRRGTLAQTCMSFSGPDTCGVANARMGDQAAAQTAENDIVTWKGVRLGAEIGVGVGAALAVTGVVLKLVGSGAPAVSAMVVPDRDGRASFAAAWRIRF